jgi:hypothetical protein
LSVPQWWWESFRVELCNELRNLRSLRKDNSKFPKRNKTCHGSSNYLKLKKEKGKMRENGLEQGKFYKPLGKEYESA